MPVVELHGIIFTDQESRVAPLFIKRFIKVSSFWQCRTVGQYRYNFLSTRRRTSGSKLAFKFAYIYNGEEVLNGS